MFPILALLPFRRALLHLFMLTIMLALFITACRIYPALELRGKIMSGLTGEFGTIKASDGGFLPEIAPEKRRSMEILPTYLLSYFPNKEFTLADMHIGDFSRGVLMTPGFVTLWIKKPESGFVLIPIVYSTSILNRFSSDSLTPVNGEVMIETVKEMYDVKGPFIFEDVNSVASSFTIYYVVLRYLLEFARALFCVLVFNTLFTGCYSIGGGAAMAGMTYRNLWIMGVYASFPALIIASFFPAFDLPYFDYSTVYLFAFLGYFMFIFNKLQRLTISRIDIIGGKKDDYDGDKRDDQSQSRT
eukprot:TRINITY_DN25867_c0_g1_i1.p2 TRINITY_DN25867_c0_g1~~TRINITY_DN25867_c0_g1_i1.p2  ORF type:complete len:301 (+),score=47.45 TRINITY_DN25867_c0_g1_i1:979-1881(+)